MAITITIQAKVDRDENRQQVYFTIKKNGDNFKFSHGSVPASLTTDAQIKAWLIERKDKIIELIQNKIANGTYKNEHPKWIAWEAAIDSATTVAQLKTILKKIVRRIA